MLCSTGSFSPNMPAPATPEMPQTTKGANAFLAPLIRFYEQERLAPLKFEFQEVESLPETPRHLLCHARDMTTRLERHHQSPIGLKALYVSQTPDSYFREVLLFAEKTGKPVEYGAIEISTGVFLKNFAAIFSKAKSLLVVYFSSISSTSSVTLKPTSGWKVTTISKTIFKFPPLPNYTAAQTFLPHQVVILSPI